MARSKKRRKSETPPSAAEASSQRPDAGDKAEPSKEKSKKPAKKDPEPEAEDAKEPEDADEDEDFEDSDDAEDLEDDDEEEEEEERAPARPASKAKKGPRVAVKPRSDKEAREGATVLVKVLRQDDPDSAPYWEEFEVEDEGNMNVISCLMAIQRNPANINGEATTPVAWDQACLEEVCGSCTMVVNGRVRQSCTALVRNLEQPITLEPMRKFPVLRDLCVDRSSMFANLKRVKAWNEIDGSHDLGPGPRISPEQQAEDYVFSTCMTCGCCLDACPQVNENSNFIGAAPIGQAYRFNNNPIGEMNARERIEALMEDGGVHACGNAQNCVEVCPKEIPLTTAIGHMGREVTFQLIKDVLGK